MYGCSSFAVCLWHPTDVCLDRAGRLFGNRPSVFLLNFIIGGVIGGFVLVWRLLVSTWYIPLTIYRLFITRGTSYIPE